MRELLEQRGGSRSVWGMLGRAGTSREGSKRKEKKHLKVD